MNNNQRRLRSYWSIISPFRRTILLIFSLAIFTTGARLLQPYFFHVIIDEVALKPGLVTEQRVEGLIKMVILLAGLTLLSVASSYWSSYRTAVLNNKFTANLRYKLLRHMLHLPLHELMKMKTGGAVARLNQDTSTVSQMMNRSIIAPILAALQAVVSLVMVFVLSWRMSLAALLVIIPMILCTYLLGKHLRPMFKEISEIGSELTARSTEMFGGVRVARIYRREIAERRMYAKIYHHLIRKTLAARRRQFMIDNMWQTAFVITQITIVVVGVYLIIYNEATVGAIMAIIMYSNRIMGPIDEVVQSYNRLNEDLAALDRIFEALNIEQDKLDRLGAVESPKKVESLEFKQVSFSYGEQKQALSDINIVVRGGQTVALVGRSGAGKSTLTDLLSRFYDPQGGAIYLNGRDIRDIKLKSYRGLIGLVQQDIFLFDGSVRENIAYAAPGATSERIIDAANRANAHEFIVELPNGYDTLIGERGVKLSGGQRQRISIARAFLLNPEILIMDEATSNLDTENEQAIQLTLKELLRNRTTFIIAHRLSTVTHSDIIIVLDEGRICEIGAHEELMARRGRYFDMIERQRSPIFFAAATS